MACKRAWASAPARSGPTTTARRSTLVVRVRNVGKEAVEFKHIWAFFVENPPTITDADGKIVKLPLGRSLGLEQVRICQHAPAAPT